MTDERAEVLQTLRALATGEVEGDGRTLAARMSAARRWELMTRPEPEARPPEAKEAASRDYPVDHEGRFYPGARPELWPLRLAWRWEPGDAKEAEAVENWRRSSSHVRWVMAGSPWPRSAWEQDPQPWHDALAALD